MGCESDSDFYEFDESLNDSINENIEDNFVNNNIEDNSNKKNGRYNSWSILDVLQMKNKLEEK